MLRACIRSSALQNLFRQFTSQILVPSFYVEEFSLFIIQPWYTHTVIPWHSRMTHGYQSYNTWTFVLSCSDSASTWYNSLLSSHTLTCYRFTHVCSSKIALTFCVHIIRSYQVKHWHSFRLHLKVCTQILCVCQTNLANWMFLQSSSWSAQANPLLLSSQTWTSVQSFAWSMQA